MQTVSSRWSGAVRGGSAQATVISKVEVLNSSGVLLASTESVVGAFQPLQLLEGEVRVDATADILRQANVRFAVDSAGAILPNTGTSLLSNTSGNEVKISRGLRYIDGTSEYMPLGVFGFAEDETADTSDQLTVALTLYDRSRRVRRAKFTKSYVIATGTNYVTAITVLLQTRFGAIVINSTPTSFTTPYLVYDSNDDPWTRITEMAAAIGYEVFFDPNGTCVLRPRVVYASGSVSSFDYIEGVDATILTVSRRSNNESTYNGVIMTGASSSNVSPPRAEAWDVDTSSATYSGYNAATGLFATTAYGQVPYFETNEKLTTNAQCTVAAQAKLDELKGRTEVIQFSAFVNPAHDHRDLIYIRRVRAKIDSFYELEAFNVPLAAGAEMTARTKQQRAA